MTILNKALVQLLLAVTIVLPDAQAGTPAEPILDLAAADGTLDSPVAPSALVSPATSGSDALPQQVASSTLVAPATSGSDALPQQGEGAASLRVTADGAPADGAPADGAPADGAPGVGAPGNLDDAEPDPAAAPGPRKCCVYLQYGDFGADLLAARCSATHCVSADQPCPDRRCPSAGWYAVDDCRTCRNP